jgi:thioesterase domain-containing protein/acyl carrier protein
LVRRATPGAAAGAPVESLAQLLGATAEDDREQVVQTFVREQIADVLGLEVAASVDPQAPFLELGFDSLTALEFRNRLNAATGLRLTPSVAFDFPTSAALATHLLSQIEAPEAASVEARSDGLGSLLRIAHAEGRMAEFAEVLSGVAGFRERFAKSHLPDSEPYHLRLAAGAASPALVCVPSAAPISGPHEYARLARSFDGEREAVALRWPGFAKMEPLPEDIEAAFELQAKSIAGAVGRRPYALLGHSTGGVLAYGMTRYLEQLQVGPAALVLIDSYHPTQRAIDDPTSLGILERLTQGGESGVAIDDARLTAMAVYLQLLAGVETPPLVCPTLLVRATEPIGGDADEPGWQARWDVPLDVVDVPGDHLTMVDSCADSTGRAISAWLQTNVAVD